MESPPEVPAPAAPAPPRKRRPFRFMFRTSVRLIVLACLLIAIAIVVVGFTPLSLGWFDDLARQGVLDSTGLKLEFDRAEWLLIPGVARLVGARLSDPADGKELLRLKSAELNVDTHALLLSVWKGPLVVDLQRIAAEGPMEIRIEQRAEKVALGGALGRAEEIVRERASRPTDTGEARQHPIVRLGSMSVSNASVRFFDATRAEPQEILRVVGADLLSDFGGGSAPRSVTCMGKIEGPKGQSQFNITLAPAVDLQSTSVTLSLARFDSREHLQASPAREFALGATKMSGRLVRSEAGGTWALDMNATNKEITLAALARDGSDEMLHDVALAGHVEWTPAEKRLRAGIASLTCREGELKGEIGLVLDGPAPFDAVVENLTLHGDSLRGLERVLFKERYLTEGSTKGASAHLHGGGKGSLRDLHLDALSVDYVISGVGLTFPEIPEPIRRIKLAGNITEKQFTLTEGSAVLQGIPVSIRGNVEGRLLEGSIAKGEITWESQGQVEGISNLINENTGGPASKIEFTGDVKGKGVVRFDGSKSKKEIQSWSDVMDLTEIEGELNFNEASVTSADFKEPVRKLKGTARVKGSELRLTGVGGVIKDVPFTADGALRGKRDFWVEPTADLRVTVSGSLDRIGDYLAWADEKLPDGWPSDLLGEAKVNASVKGPVSDPRAMTFKADAEVRNLSVGIKSEETTGSLKLPLAKISLTPSEVRIAETKGTWGTVPATLSASATPSGGQFAVKADANFKEYMKVLPFILRDFEVDGQVAAEYSGKIKADSRRIRKAKTFADLLPPKAEPAAPGAAPAAVPPDEIKWSLEDGGRIIATNVDFTLDKMPTRVNGITGEVRYSNRKLWTDQPVAVNAGEHSRNTRAMFSMNIPNEADPLDLQIKLTGDFIDIDDWLKDWREGKHFPERKPATTQRDIERLRESITVDVETKGVKYRGALLEDLSGKLVYENRRGRRDNLRWDNVHARQGEGIVDLQGYWRMWDTKEIRVYDIGVENMAVAEVMQAFFDETQRGGISSGSVSGRIHLEQEGSGSPPFNGFGYCKVNNSRFVSNAVLGQLGNLLGLQDIFGDITFNTIDARFDVVNSAIAMKGNDGATFENPSFIYPLNLKMKGQIGPSSALNLDISLQFLPAVNKIPIIGQVWKLVNGLTGRVLRYQVVGTMKDPRINVLPKLVVP